MSYSVVKCPVRTVSLSFHCERSARETVDSRVLQSAAVRAERVELPFPESESGVLPIERSPSCVGLERFELSPRGVKIRCAAVTPQTLNRVCGRAFESVQHVVGEPRIELGGARRPRGLQPRQEPRLSARPKRREPAEVLPRAGSQSFGSISLTYESGSLRGFTCLRSLRSIANEEQP